MSLGASGNFATSFDALIKPAFQGSSKLLNTVRVKDGVIGSTHKFFVGGKIQASDRVRFGDAVLANGTQSLVTATLSDKEVAEGVDILDINKLTYDEKAFHVQNIGAAMGRAADQLIIDAMVASSFATIVNEDIGTANSGLNSAKLRRAKRLMDANGVPQGERYVATTARGLEDMLGETAVTSADFNSVRALVNGEIDTWLGFKFIIIESRDEGGLPLYTSGTVVRNNLIWHKQAVGLAIGSNIRNEVNYLPLSSSWLLKSMFSMGAVTIDTNGVITLLTYES